MTAALLIALLAAKALAAGPAIVADLPASLVAHVWQDAVVACVFLAIERLAPRRAAATAYALVVAWAALNVPVVWTLSSPLTPGMLRGASPTLGGSFTHAATPGALLAIGGVLAIGAVAARRPILGTRAATVAVLAVAAATAPFGTACERASAARGTHRNAVWSLFDRVLPRVPDRTSAERDGLDVRDVRLDPRASAGPGASAGPDLRDLRGAARGRDVVLVVLESTGARYLRPWGAADDPMPFLTELAATSLVFERAYCVVPESIRNLLALLTSHAPAADATPEDHRGLPLRSLATELRARGYRSALVHSGRFAYLGMDAVVDAADFDVAEDAGDIGGNRRSSFGVDDPSSVRRALELAAATPPDRRLFLAWLPVSGHHPYDGPGGPFPADDDLGRYRNALHHADECLRQLVDGLAAQGRHPLLVVLGDHGEAFGQHEGNYGHTMFLYEENVHVPLLVALPGTQPGSARARRTPAVASALDVAPTVLDLLGVAPPPAWEGRSLLTPGRRAAPMFTDLGELRLALVDGNRKLHHEPRSGLTRSYDLAADPGEEHDLGHGPRLDAALDALLRWCSRERAGLR